jgi:hypothetical protein
MYQTASAGSPKHKSRKIQRSGIFVIARMVQGKRLGLSEPLTMVPSRRNGIQYFLQKSGVKKSLCRKPSCHLVRTAGWLNPNDPIDPYPQVTHAAIAGQMSLVPTSFSSGGVNRSLTSSSGKSCGTTLPQNIIRCQCHASFCKILATT